MAIANQGYRRDLNLSETENEEEAISNLMGTGIDDDLRYLQNNLRNTSRIAFNKVDSAGFFSFDEDKTIAIQSISSEKELNENNTIIKLILTEPYLLKVGNLVELAGIPDSSDASILNGQYSVRTISRDLITVRLKKNNLVYENSSIPISGVSFIHKADNIFTYTQDDVVNVSVQTTFTVGSSSTVLSPNTDYYVTDSNGINKFKLSYTASDSIAGVTTIAIPHSISSPTVLSTPSGSSQFEFVRKDPVHRDQLLFFRYPQIQDNESFSYLSGSINDTFTTTQSNIETAEYFTLKKYRGDKGLVSTDESIKYEGSVVLNDPQNYNSDSDFVLNEGVEGSPAPGIYIGGTRAFSSDNNPWGKEGVPNAVGSALTTSSEEVSIGELTFLDGSLLSSSEEGSMIIEGIGDDVADVSAVANSFTHKVPIKIEDASGNQESYFLLVSDT